jgi:phage-related holin
MQEIIKSLTINHHSLYVILSILIQTFSTSQQACAILLISMLFDFITGILAHWIEFKKESIQKKYIIESAKLRLTAVKFTCYAMGILGAWGIETVFLIQKIPSGYISTESLTLTTIITGFFCVIEIYSIFFENIKRMGFDIVQNIKNIALVSWKLYKIIKNGPSDN